MGSLFCARCAPRHRCGEIPDLVHGVVVRPGRLAPPGDPVPFISSAEVNSACGNSRPSGCEFTALTAPPHLRWGPKRARPTAPSAPRFPRTPGSRPLCVPPPLRRNTGSRPWRGRAPRPARAARGPRSFHILGGSEFRLRKFSPFGLRIYGAYRAAPSAMGPQKSTTYCALRSTLPAHTGLAPAARPATVAAKYRISSMAWSCSFLG